MTTVYFVLSAFEVPDVMNKFLIIYESITSTSSLLPILLNPLMRLNTEHLIPHL
jgi:hypothetical protein